jgi:acetyl esterase/lipase
MVQIKSLSPGSGGILCRSYRASECFTDLNPGTDALGYILSPLTGLTKGRGESFILRRILTIARLSFGILCLLVSSLAVLPAPTTKLWMLAIGVTEWGHILALIALVPLLPGWRGSRMGRIGAAAGIAAALLALSPILRAIPIANRLPSQLRDAFGEASVRAGNDSPLSARKLIFGASSLAVDQKTLVYVVRDKESLTLDLFQGAKGQTPTPCVIVIHGGSWQNGDSTQLLSLNGYLAAHGYTVAALNYRLGREHQFPAALDDVRAAIYYLKENAEELGLDARNFVLLGRSAGGQLALLAAYTAHDPSIRGVVSLYGPADLVYAYEHPANPLVFDSRGVLEAYLGGSPDQVKSQYDAASPINFVGEDTPPTLLIHGGRDELVSPAQSERLAGALKRAGRPSLLLILPWATHGCDYNFSGPCGQISTFAVERFLKAVMSDE